jgi:hypothetical protein
LSWSRVQWRYLTLGSHVCLPKTYSLLYYVSQLTHYNSCVASLPMGMPYSRMCSYLQLYFARQRYPAMSHVVALPAKGNKKFCEEIIACFRLIRHRQHRKGDTQTYRQLSVVNLFTKFAAIKALYWSRSTITDFTLKVHIFTVAASYRNNLGQQRSYKTIKLSQRHTTIILKLCLLSETNLKSVNYHDGYTRHYVRIDWNV